MRVRRNFSVPNSHDPNNLLMKKTAKKSLDAAKKSLLFLALLVLLDRLWLLAGLFNRHVRLLFFKNGRIDLLLRKNYVWQRRIIEFCHRVGPGSGSSCIENKWRVDFQMYLAWLVRRQGSGNLIGDRIHIRSRPHDWY